MVAVGCVNHLRLFKVDVTAYSVEADGNKLLDGKYITSFVEISPDKLLCCSSDTNEYWWVDVASRQESKFVSSLSKPFCVKMFPGFHPQHFPFVLAREEDHVCILNTNKNQIFKIATCKAWHDNSYTYCDRINFVGKEPNDFSFVTTGGWNEVLRFKIEAELMKVLSLA